VKLKRGFGRAGISVKFAAVCVVVKCTTATHHGAEMRNKIKRRLALFRNYLSNASTLIQTNISRQFSGACGKIVD